VSEYTNLDDAKELARFLKMSVAWVRKASRNGLPHVKVGRAVRFDGGPLGAWRRRFRGRGRPLLVAAACENRALRRRWQSWPIN
jgi:hypothetical protein